jgi:stage III sporulation protein AG
MDKEVVVVSNSNSSTSKSKSIFARLEGLMTKKNIKIILLVIVGLISVILLFGLGSGKSKSTSSNVVTTSSYISTMDYCKIIENKLIDVLSKVDGAGTVSVMVTVDGSPELIYANEQDKTSSTNSSGSTTSSTYSSPIIIDANGSSSALVMTEVLPAVKGVIVVSSGAGKVETRLNLLKAVSTLLDISTEQVTVLKGV